MTNYDTSEKIARISDILEQITALNNLLDLQKKHIAEPSTIKQYETMRKQFLDELGQLMKEFRLKVLPLDLAA